MAMPVGDRSSLLYADKDGFTVNQPVQKKELNDIDVKGPFINRMHWYMYRKFRPQCESGQIKLTDINFKYKDHIILYNCLDGKITTFGDTKISKYLCCCVNMDLNENQQTMAKDIFRAIFIDLEIHYGTDVALKLFNTHGNYNYMHNGDFKCIKVNELDEIYEEAEQIAKEKGFDIENIKQTQLKVDFLHGNRPPLAQPPLWERVINNMSSNNNMNNDNDYYYE
jgi:hypothetical protein